MAERNPLLIGSVGLGITVMLAGSCVPSDKGSEKAPSIIFIMVDDMGYGDPGAYGQRLIQTPRIDLMADQGMMFTDVYAGSPVCAPSRSVLMTGRHTGHTTVRGNFGLPGHGGVPCTGGSGGLRVPLTDSDVTVADVLKEAGYVTGITGKWGLGEPGTTGIPNLQGFDEWFGLLNQRRAHSHYPKYVWHNMEKVYLEGNTGTIEDFAVEKHHFHELITEFALEFIEKHSEGDQPFFLYLPYTFPHDRFQIDALEPYAEAADWPEQARVYASMITALDSDVGRILDLLKSVAIEKNTIVFFCSDNGAAIRYDGLFDSSGPLRGRKRDLYEGGIRTPMIVWWPEHIKAGSVSDATWYFADVLPTLADLAGTEAPGEIDGISVMPSLFGEPLPELSDRPLYWEFYEGGFQQAARKGKWKAIRTNVDHPLELYDLESDIGENNDISGNHPELTTWFETYLREARIPSPNWPSPLD